MGCPAKALSFVDDVAWLAEGDGANEISEILEKAAAASHEWAEANAVAFDAQKTEAIPLSRGRKRKTPTPPLGAYRSKAERSTSTNRPPGGSESGLIES